MQRTVTTSSKLPRKRADSWERRAAGYVWACRHDSGLLVDCLMHSNHSACIHQRCACAHAEVKFDQSGSDSCLDLSKCSNLFSGAGWLYASARSGCRSLSCSQLTINTKEHARHL